MIFSFSDFQLDTHQLQLRRAGAAQPLEPLVFDLLTYLVTNRDRIVSRAELLEQLWSGKVVSESALSSAIKAARHALGDNGQTQGFIATFNRRGYRFVADMDAPEPQHELGVDQSSWIANVLGEDISIHLARIPGFLVLSRNTAAQYRQREMSIQHIASRG